MQIHYYQHHYTQYLDDAMQHFKKQQITDESSLVPSTVVSASSTSSSLFISYQEFYIKQLNTLDLYKDYLKWQKIGNTEFGFSFCQYPFILSIEAKRKMLEQDSEQQMILNAKVYLLFLFEKLFVKFELFYLIIIEKLFNTC